jgi:hypothetical protein
MADQQAIGAMLRGMVQECEQWSAGADRQTGLTSRFDHHPLLYEQRCERTTMEATWNEAAGDEWKSGRFSGWGRMPRGWSGSPEQAPGNDA